MSGASGKVQVAGGMWLRGMVRPIFILLFAVALTGCGLFSKSYLETFENAGGWGSSDTEGVRLAVADERLELTVDFPGSMFWTTAGRRNLDNGSFAVDVTALDGSAEVAYGLIFRAESDTQSFYYFLLSADGYYSVGGCNAGCADVSDFIIMTDHQWVLAEGSEIGLNVPHSLRVDANANEMVFYLDDREIQRTTDGTLPSGDIGILVQTFDSGATVAFDNLSFEPSE